MTYADLLAQHGYASDIPEDELERYRESERARTTDPMSHLAGTEPAMSYDEEEPVMTHYHVVCFINGCLNDYDSGPYDTLEDAREALAQEVAYSEDTMHDFIPAGVDRFEARNSLFILTIESCSEAECEESVR